MDTDELYNKLGETPAKTPVKAIDAKTGRVFEILALVFEPRDANMTTDRVWLKVGESDG